MASGGVGGWGGVIVAGAAVRELMAENIENAGLEDRVEPANSGRAGLRSGEDDRSSSMTLRLCTVGLTSSKSASFYDVYE